MISRWTGRLRSGVTSRLVVGVIAGLSMTAAIETAAQEGTPRLLLHARLASLGETCAPPLSGCGELSVTGALYGVGFYYLYLVAHTPAPATGLRELHTGISYDLTTVSGVDVFRWNLCADSETPSAGWFQEGGDNIITWDEGDCPADSFEVAGYFYAAAYTPAQFALVPPAADSVRVTPCGGDRIALDPTALGIIGFGGDAGCNPCTDACMYVPVEPTTWSTIKSFFRSR